MKWGVYIYVFFLAHIKFLFAASIAEATTSLSFVEILITTTAGALFCFNLFYFISKYLNLDFNNQNQNQIQNPRKVVEKRFISLRVLGYLLKMEPQSPNLRISWKTANKMFHLLTFVIDH